MGEGAFGALEGQVFAEFGEEGIDVGLGDDVAVFVALGLDAVEFAVDVFGDQVDACVVAQIEFRPEPDAGELRPIERQLREQTFHQALEAGSQHSLVALRLLTKARQHFIQRHAHGLVSVAPWAEAAKKARILSRTHRRLATA